MKTHKGLIKGVSPTYLLFVLHGRDISRPLVRRVAEYLGYSELPAVYEEYLEYLRERRRRLREIVRMLDEQAEGAAGTPSAKRRWQDGKDQSNS